MEVKGSHGPTTAIQLHEPFDVIASRGEGDDGLSLAQRRNRQTWIRNARLGVLKMQEDVNAYMTDRLELEKAAFGRDGGRSAPVSVKSLKAGEKKVKAKGSGGKKSAADSNDEDDV